MSGLFRVTGLVDAESRAALQRALAGREVWLASASPRRRAILRSCGIRHHAIGHTLDEPAPAGPDWRRWVRTWSLRKTRSASSGLNHGLIIAADTIVVCGTRGLGKPANPAQAESMLRRLSGRVHQVITGVAVISVEDAKWSTGSAVTHVRFRSLSDREIRRYVRTGEPMDKAGAYAVQGEAGRFVSQIDGAVDNVVGLPVECLANVVAKVTL
ncbi:MAG: septum formation protein Maf [candidate division Zixibacteria bacterium]|nr:septum formation protein Maf [candidate division Zixibacteria bacterium]